MMRNERGFTIMELLVVIVIIGVLAAIGVPAYNNMTKRARIAACQANQHTLQTGVAMFYADTGTYPTLINQLSGGADGTGVKYIDNATSIKCPVGGESYSIDGSHKIVCSVADHTLP